MKHFNLDGSFQFVQDPFPAFRSELIFGRNKRDFQFLPTKVSVNEDGLLPDEQFKLIRTKEKGTLLVVPGEDKTPRALVMCGINDGFRGGSSVREKDTSANILKHCQAAAATDGRLEIIALMNPGEQIVMSTYGRRTNDVVIIRWDGNNISKTRMSKSEFEAESDSLAEYEEL